MVPGLDISVSGDARAVFLLGGAPQAIAALAAPHLGLEATLLWIAADRALLVAALGVELAEGWHDSGVAISALHDAHLRIDIRGPAAAELLRRGSLSLALSDKGPGTALSFAGVTVLVEHLADGARLHVERPLAAHVWHWLLAAISTTTEDHP